MNIINKIKSWLGLEPKLGSYFFGVKIIDTNGVAQGVSIRVGAITIRNYLQAIGEGDVPNTVVFEKTGYSPASTTSPTTLWNVGTNYVFPTANIAVEIVSTSANDIAVTGSGARTVFLRYLSSDYVEHEWTFDLNGVTPVAGPTNFFRTNMFHMVTSGATGMVAGVVSLRLVGGAATVYDQIAVGSSTGRNSVYTVPLGKTVFIHDVMFSCAYSTAGKSERMVLFTSVTPNQVTSTTGLIFWPKYEAMLVDGNVQKVDGAPIICPEKTDIKVNIFGEANAQSTVNYSGWTKIN